MGEGGEGDEEDEDSEIESEDAFGSSDDDRFEGWRFTGNEAVDLVTAWDMDDQDQLEERDKQQRKRVKKEETKGDMGNGSSASENDELSEDGDDNDDIQSDLSVSDAEDGDHARLHSFVQSLSQKQDTSNISSEEPKQTQISASDLLQYVKDPTQRQSLKILQNTERKGPEEYKGGIPGRLTAPLPKRQQDRLDRSAAYEKSKKELSRWVDTVKQNRRAEHLQFPLVDPNDPIAHASRQLPQIREKPMTELEKKVQEIMAESGMVKEGSEVKREEDDLAEQKVSFEEVQAKRSELRKQRDLLFREEAKARRIKKIKRKWDGGARTAMEDMARRDEELRRRVDGREENDDSWASDDASRDYSSDDEDEALEEKLLHLERQTNEGPTSKLGSMAFMQRAEAARKARNDAEIQELRRQLNGQGNGDFDPNTDSAQTAGRQSFGVKNEQASTHPPKRPLRLSEFEERLSDEGLSNHEDTDEISAKAASQPISRVDSPAKQLLMTFTRSTKQSAQVNGTLQRKQQNMIKSTKPHETALDNYISHSESEPDDQPVGSGKAASLTLAHDIFAGDDDIIKEFQKEKQEVVLAEGDQIIDNALPGWGAWTGAGISKKDQTRTKNKFLTTTKGIAPQKRQDAKLEKVIVNEKRVKKNGKYLATELPHPFESRQQYERSLRLPLGPEWTTKSTFQDATKPRVLVKQGIIRAMQRPKE
ncbi:hypothetical protein DV736_g1146, partial [Chaetothyriales sp. CBS 134916]